MTVPETARQRGSTDRPATGSGTAAWAWAALLVAVAGLAGSLFLSLGLELKACPLCFYQRTFAMSLVAVLGMGLGTGITRPGRVGLVAVPLAAAGLGVAAFHVFLESAGKLECPEGLFGWGTAPKQSLAVFVVILALLVGDVLNGPALLPGRWPALVGGLVLGVLLAVASCVSNPPMPAAPKEPYPKPPDVCRPPFVPA